MKIQRNNRRGVTLLFVVSMIVLFLLMGTTFVVIANDYFRASRKRAIIQNREVDTTSYVQQAFYNFVRGPELENTNSVLRGHDLLSDMYGYGLKASVRSAQVVNGGRNTFIKIQLNDTTWTVPDTRRPTGSSPARLLGLRNLLDDARARAAGTGLPEDLVGGAYDTTTTGIEYPSLTPETPSYYPTPTDLGKRYMGSINPVKSPLDVPGYFGGQVMSFTSGVAKGISCRIVDYSVTINASDEVVREFIVLPLSDVQGPGRNGSATASPLDNEAITLNGIAVTEIESIGEIWSTYPARPTTMTTVLANAPCTVVINGKPFSGFGAGSYAHDQAAPALDEFRSDGFFAGWPNQARFNPSSLPQYTGNWQDTFFAGDHFGDSQQRGYSSVNVAVNEPYDAFDQDNVFLAQPPNVAGSSDIGASFNPVFMAPINAARGDGLENLAVNNVSDYSDPMNKIYIPENLYSFRPVHQWDPDPSVAPGTLLANSTANANFPNIWDHDVDSPPAGFTAVPHQPQTRPLDVDNDGDGVMDSVWIDLGFGVLTTPQGKKYKPLVAAMIVEMDSRLNINTHGNMADAESRATSNPGEFMTKLDFLGVPVGSGLANAMPRGLGWGPPEISLSPLVADYGSLLYGLPQPNATNPFATTAVSVPGRYGYDRFPGRATGDPEAGFRFSDHPRWSPVGWNPTNSVPRFQNTGVFQSSPLDIQGRFAYGFSADLYEQLDDGTGTLLNYPVGMPIADIDESQWPPQGLYYSNVLGNYPGFGFEVDNSPYEVSLFRPSSNLSNTNNTRLGINDDTLYTPDELEAVLRPYDVDSNLLPRRLWDMLDILGTSPESVRALMTTDSWEVPALPPADKSVPERLYEILTNGHNAMSHADAFLWMRGGPGGGAYRSLLASEIMKGLPMNVNRPFGDGLDNDLDGIHDESWDTQPWENQDPSFSDANKLLVNESATPPVADSSAAYTYEYIPGTHAEPAAVDRIGIDHNNDGVLDERDHFARQIFARHLFILTWLVTSDSFDTDGNPLIADFNRDTVEDDNDIAFLAQWCINVADFRDPDSICTPFEFDYDPWDGWDVDSHLGAAEGAPYVRTGDRGLVWGLERPEILITESFATHERRMEDREGDGGQFDSRYVPKSSVFVELFNPWSTSPSSQKRPAEFYDASGRIALTAQNRVIDPNLTTGASDDVADPVWRLVFTQGQVYDPSANVQNRRVYFVEPGVDVEPNGDGNWFYPSQTAFGGEPAVPVPSLAAGSYAVVGSAGVIDSNDNYRTTFGRRSDLGVIPPTNLMLDETRSITLIPGLGPNRGVEKNSWDGTNWVQDLRDADTGRPGYCIAIPVNRQGRDTRADGEDREDVYRSLGMTDPNGGYDRDGVLDLMEIDPDGMGGDGDGLQFQTHVVNGADRDATYTHPDLRDAGLLKDGVTTGARFVHLQRLANPESPYHAVYNPYISVDNAPVDLMSFNGILPAGLEDQTLTPATEVPDYAFDSHERGELGGTDRLLWPVGNRRGSAGAAPSPAATPDDAGHLQLVENEFVESFGRMNQVHRTAGMENQPFDNFVWNNRPYVSEYELAVVPMLRSELMLQQGGFSAQGGSHLLLFNDTILKQVFDYLEVPPRFVRAEYGMTPGDFDGDPITATNGYTVFNPPFNFVSRYRYPGKVNINTITNSTSTIWTNGMMQNWGVPFGSLTAVRGDRVFTNAFDPGYYGGSTGTTRSSSVTIDPIRPDGVGAFEAPRVVPDPQLTDGDNRGDGSLLRTNPTGAPTLFRTASNVAANPANDYYLQTTSVSKLANISTNRSSVFAIWVTVGYFEIDESGRLGAEVGSDTGEIKRNRGFYMYDRSIPVAFEPGINHNIERGILVQSVIE